jgi:hypothetical protein
MFTTGSKLLFGLATASAVALLLYGITQDWGALGTVGLATALIALCLLGGMALYTRDGDIEPDDPSVAQASATVGSPGASLWPLVGALGVGLVGVGLVTAQPVFVLGLVALLVAFVEWLVQAWSERASADPEFNRLARKRLLNPIEFPILGAVGLGVVIFAFSRIMLAVSKVSGAVLFIVVASIILLFGFIFALRPKVTTSVVAGICVLGGLGIVAGGIAGAAQGERADLVAAAEEGHYLNKECGPDADKYFDKKALNHVSSKTGAFATLTLEGGQLRADVSGIGPADSITLQRSNASDIVFVNRDPGEFRLTADLGTAPVVDESGTALEGPDGNPILQPVEDCTQLMGQNNASVLVVTIPKPSNPDTPYRLFVPGVPGAEIEIVVP